MKTSPFLTLEATFYNGPQGIQQGPPALSILVRDPKNLRYLPAIERWAQSQPDMHGYVLTLYNLNCKARDIDQCKMPAPSGAAVPAGAASAAH